MKTIQTIGYHSWLELKRDLFLELFGRGAFQTGRYLFRGEGNAEWRLASAFDRQFASLAHEERLKLWDELTVQWRRGCEEIGVPEAVVTDDHKLWALGQHHGLPTRLLDWSTSPYIAAFFAFKEWMTRLPEDFSHVAIWVLHLDNPVWSKETGVEIVTPPALDNIRLFNQSGKFTLARTPLPTLEEYVEQTATDLALTKVMLPSTEAAMALPDLDSMGINGYHLFPDLTGLASTTTMRLLMNLTTPPL